MLCQTKPSTSRSHVGQRRVGREGTGQGRGKQESRKVKQQKSRKAEQQEKQDKQESRKFELELS